MCVYDFVIKSWTYQQEKKYTVFLKLDSLYTSPLLHPFSYKWYKFVLFYDGKFHFIYLFLCCWTPGCFIIYPWCIYCSEHWCVSISVVWVLWVNIQVGLGHMEHLFFRFLRNLHTDLHVVAGLVCVPTTESPPLPPHPSICSDLFLNDAVLSEVVWNLNIVWFPFLWWLVRLNMPHVFIGYP